MREAQYTLAVAVEEIGKSLWPLEDMEISSGVYTFWYQDLCSKALTKEGKEFKSMSRGVNSESKLIGRRQEPLS